jgi:F420-non-reducing hydrogenase iron-sulfur subunit
MSNADKPKIVAFVCNWCAYAGADLAGVSRMQYPPNVRLIRLMCTGRVNTGFLLKAFTAGADGVLVSGWHIGDCHYLEGNKKCQKVVEETWEIMRLLGIDDRRLRLKWVSASEGALFAAEIQSYVELLKELGENPLSEAPLCRIIQAPQEETMEQVAAAASEG